MLNWIIFSLIDIFLCVILVQAQMDITQILVQEELLVEEIAKKAIFNQQRICDSLPGCTLETCSRLTCSPRDFGDKSKLQCSTNINCGNRSCHGTLISENQSYVRIPSSVPRETNKNLNWSICGQKPLDEILRQSWLYNSSRYSKGWIYFGSAEGFMYIFPGRDYVDDSCSQYDPRKRPWYINSLAVIKSLYIILDTSMSMSNFFSSITKTTCLDVGKNIIRELLDTLGNKDEVAISTSSHQFTERVSATQDEILKQDEILSLRKVLTTVEVEALQMDLKNSLEGALKFFNSSSKLKVLMILTDGRLDDSFNTTTDMEIIFQELNQENVVVFLYRIGMKEEPYNGKLHLMKNKLNMTMKNVTESDNPLWVIHNYFDYVAWLRFVDVNKVPIWVDLYLDAAGLGNLTTVTYPAFDDNQHLIGVAGLDLFANGLILEFGQLAVDDAISKKSPLPSNPQQHFPLAQEVANEAMSCQISTRVVPLCPGTLVQDPKYTCCGDTCKSSASTPIRDSKNVSKKVIIGGTVGGIVAALGIVGLTFAYVKRVKRKRKQVRTIQAHVVTEDALPGTDIGIVRL